MEHLRQFAGVHKGRHRDGQQHRDRKQQQNNQILTELLQKIATFLDAPDGVEVVLQLADGGENREEQRRHAD